MCVSVSVHVARVFVLALSDVVEVIITLIAHSCSHMSNSKVNVS